MGDVVSLKSKSQKIELFRDNFLNNIVTTLPYLTKDEENFSGTLERYPNREEVPIEINEVLVVEFYSKLQ